MIILLFGQPASGKTTLSDALTEKKISYTEQYFQKYGIDGSIITRWYGKKVIKIDGDKWREITKNKDYSKQGRLINLKGAFDMALYLEKEGYVVVLSFVTPYQELRDYLKDNAEDLLQFHLTYSGNRGRDDRFAPDFEIPNNVLSMDSAKYDIEEWHKINYDVLSIDTSKYDLEECKAIIFAAYQDKIDPRWPSNLKSHFIV